MPEHDYYDRGRCPAQAAADRLFLLPLPDGFEPDRPSSHIDRVSVYAKVLGIPLEDLYPAIDVTPNAHEPKANT